MINHPAIFNSTIVKYFLVTNKRNFVTPTIAYDLTIPIRSKIFSYKNFVSELDVDQFVARPTIFTCSGDKSPFVNKHHVHILSGDLGILKKPRKTICKGPQHHDNKTINFHDIKNNIFVVQINAHPPGAISRVHLRSLSQSESIG